VEAISLDFGHPTHTVFDIFNLPEAGSLRLEVTGFSGAFSVPCETRPAEPIAEKGKIDICFLEEKLAKAVLRLAFDKKTQGVQIDIALLCQTPKTGQKLIPFNVKDVEKQLPQMLAMQAQAQHVIDALKPKAPQRRGLQQDFDQKKVIIEQLAGLLELYKAANKNAKLHFRVFNQFDEGQVDLLTTATPETKVERSSESPKKTPKKKASP
jgi:hypothetical protein